MKEVLERKDLSADVLIIGGGTAGCYAAYTLAKSSPDIDILIVEKAHIKRSGCLAAGVNAINAYITEGHTPEFYADYATHDAAGIVRDDLLMSIAKRFNAVTEELERLGLVILKDENGDYVTRGDRNIKINGENIKPILANALKSYDNITVLNHVEITDLIKSEDDTDRVAGAVGFSTDSDVAYVIRAGSILCSTGGASGLYRPNNPGFSRHKMWYPPFNTGAGYAFGLLAGAEMTTLEMRFIALRCKDTIAPTGTIAQGVHAKQTNSLGEVYEDKYGLRTYERLYGTVSENREGRGPCYLDTTHIDDETEESLLKAYLNMAPSQTLKWLELGASPKEHPVEVEGTEPYVVGGHTASGYWVDEGRRTTVKGLYAAGDVAGGAPQKYVTGALAEGEIAAESILNDRTSGDDKDSRLDEKEVLHILTSYNRALTNPASQLTIEQTEEAMQKVMDEYAGGITKDYRYNEASLKIAESKIDILIEVIPKLSASDTLDLLHIYEIRERLIVCKALIKHLSARKENRWKSFALNTDYPDTDPEFEKYINSVYKDGTIQILYKEIVKRGDDPVRFGGDVS